MAALGIGFLGAGGIAYAHASGMLWRHDLFRLVAAADTDAARLAGFADRYGVPKRYADNRAVIEDPEVDAVVVLLPHHLHEEACVAAFAAGKHVLVEKPIARTLAEADRIIAAGRRAGRCLMVAHNQRYDARHRRVRKLIEERALGEIFLARADHYQDVNAAPGSWWRSREQVGGGCVIGSGIHRLDLLRWFLGEPEEISAQLTWDAARIEGEVGCVASIRFAGGKIADFICNWGMRRHGGESLGVYGSDGSATIPMQGEGELIASPDHQRRVLAGEPGESMWEHFRRCIDTGATPLTSGPDGRASLALVLDVVRAGEQRAVVRATPAAPIAAAPAAVAKGA
jgi:predicted dehydrogenase